jgi:diaminopimelate epimerase
VAPSSDPHLLRPHDLVVVEKREGWLRARSGSIEVVAFQNPPDKRSIPTIAHSHVFIRCTNAPAFEAHLDRLDSAFRSRSPFLQRVPAAVVGVAEAGAQPSPKRRRVASAALEPPLAAVAAPSPPPGPRFVKYSGLGNDFAVFFGGMKSCAPFAAAQAAAICRRGHGVGADGVIVARRARAEDGDECGAADVRMELLNADGSAPEMCGNGIRAFVKFVVERIDGFAAKTPLRVATPAGVRDCYWRTEPSAWADGSATPLHRAFVVRVNMGRPRFAERATIPGRHHWTTTLGKPPRGLWGPGIFPHAGGVLIELADAQFPAITLFACDVGNPHAVAMHWVAEDSRKSIATVSCLLFTVTFHANPAHNLTRSP